MGLKEVILELELMYPDVDNVPMSILVEYGYGHNGKNMCKGYDKFGYMVGFRQRIDDPESYMLMAIVREVQLRGNDT